MFIRTERREYRSSSWFGTRFSRTSHGKVTPVSGLRRLRVPHTQVFSCATPMNMIPSSRSKPARYC
jgi:hypothetical protein